MMIASLLLSWSHSVTNTFNMRATSLGISTGSVAASENVVTGWIPFFFSRSLMSSIMFRISLKTNSTFPTLCHGQHNYCSLIRTDLICGIWTKCARPHCFSLIFLSRPSNPLEPSNWRNHNYTSKKKSATLSWNVNNEFFTLYAYSMAKQSE